MDLISIIDKYFTNLNIPSSKANIKRLKKVNEELNHGFEIDAINLSSDFNNAFEYINSSLKKRKKEKALEGVG